jgi:hypothetical protein
VISQVIPLTGYPVIPFPPSPKSQAVCEKAKSAGVMLIDVTAVPRITIAWLGTGWNSSVPKSWKSCVQIWKDETFGADLED